MRAPALHQDLVALVTREPRSIAPRDLQRAFDVVQGGLGYGADERAAIGMADSQ